MAEARVDEFTLCKRQFALNGAGEDLESATLTVGADGMNEIQNIAVVRHSNSSPGLVLLVALEGRYGKRVAV